MEDPVREHECKKVEEYIARINLEAMNRINHDLTFMTAVQNGFSDNKLPTLDFSLRMMEDGKVKHSYFAKTMKNRKTMERNSMMGMKQKFCILTIEMTRRIYNLEKDDKEEKAMLIVYP